MTDRVDPERLPDTYTPAFVQVREQGPVYVADYSILESGWIRVTEWPGDRVKLPPHKVAAIREVQTEFYDKTEGEGFCRKRVAQKKHREQARPDDPDGEQPVIADD
jgi:hypothetical protein